jgi:transcriptional regulator with XRE-family HTH domain
MSPRPKNLPREELDFRESLVKEPAEIGRIARRRRVAAGLTQIEAAALCKVGTRVLSDLENVKPTAHLGKALQVLGGLGVEVLLKKKGYGR